MAQIYASTAPFSTKNSNVEKIRQSVTYHPSIWRDHFLAFTDDVTEVTAVEKVQHEKQMQKVKKLLDQTPDDSTLKIELIDAIQRLGIGYRFEKEIEESLRQIHDNYEILSSKDKDDDVHVIALRFRLLREQGYRVPCDVFNKLIDDKGNFRESLMNDIKGMLSVYEASYYGTNGEEILDKILEFFSSHLESLIPQMNNIDSLSKRVTYALRWPIRKTLKRMGAKEFMSFYQEDESHNEMLLNLAKLDFNLMQKMHQRELHHITRWWENLDFKNKLPFARDRVVECYFWSLTVHFEPKYEVARTFFAKVIAMISIMDDIYDVYGTLDELRRFTEIIRRWDIKGVDELPSYMGIFYEALLSVYKETEDKMLKEGRFYGVGYAKKEFTKLAEAYMQEAEWCYSKYVPTLEEYMKVGDESSGHKTLATTSLAVMKQVSKQDLDWITNKPPIIHISMKLGRLMDDLVGLGIEQKVTAVNCYMKENDCTVTEALSELSKKVKELWKDMNAELMAEPKVASAPIIDRIFNLTLALCIMYGGGLDAYTISTTILKSFIQSVLIDPAI